MSNKNTSNSSDSTLLLSFSKYHGLGNDFIIVDNRNRIFDPKHVKHLCDRHRGVGADGVMLVENDDSTDSTAINADLTHLPADIRYRIYNSDGSEAQICGNGLRCFVKYLSDSSIVNSSIMRIRTNIGILECEQLSNGLVRTVLGCATTDLKEVPGKHPNGKENMIDYALEDLKLVRTAEEEEKGEISSKDSSDTKSILASLPPKITVIGTGNPHCVIFVDQDVEMYDVSAIGQYLQNRKDIFPESVNVEVVQVLSASKLKMRVYERGCGETQACGTGAAASVVAGYITGRNHENVTVELRGGDLQVKVVDKDSLKIELTGPAVHVFDGKVKLQ